MVKYTHFRFHVVIDSMDCCPNSPRLDCKNDENKVMLVFLRRMRHVMRFRSPMIHIAYLEVYGHWEGGASVVCSNCINRNSMRTFKSKRKSIFCGIVYEKVAWNILVPLWLRKQIAIKYSNLKQLCNWSDREENGIFNYFFYSFFVPFQLRFGENDILSLQSMRTIRIDDNCWMRDFNSRKWKWLRPQHDTWVNVISRVASLDVANQMISRRITWVSDDSTTEYARSSVQRMTRQINHTHKSLFNCFSFFLFLFFASVYN